MSKAESKNVLKCLDDKAALISRARRILAAIETELNGLAEEERTEVWEMIVENMS